MWKPIKKEIKKGTIKYQIIKDENLITFKDWIEEIQSSEEFIEFFIELLRDNDFEGLFWEVKPTTQKEINEIFEFVLVESNHLGEVKPDNSAFSKYFEDEMEVVSFSNLRGDARLIVPIPVSEKTDYAHLMKFIRLAPQVQLLEFWKKVGEEYSKQIGEKPKWLSTAGLGVYWLHVRIDSRPKYYRHDEYKQIIRK